MSLLSSTFGFITVGLVIFGEDYASPLESKKKSEVVPVLN
jgi:hypothetical protein